MGQNASIETNFKEFYFKWRPHKVIKGFVYIFISYAQNSTDEKNLNYQPLRLKILKKNNNLLIWNLSVLKVNLILLLNN